MLSHFDQRKEVRLHCLEVGPERKDADIPQQLRPPHTKKSLSFREHGRTIMMREGTIWIGNVALREGVF